MFQRSFEQQDFQWKFWLFVWLAVFMLISFVFYKSLGKEKIQENPAELKTTMHGYLNHVLSLQPYLASDKEFSDPRNATEIRSHLKALSELAGNAARHAEMTAPRFRFSRQLLSSQFGSALQAFESGVPTFARASVNASLSLCMSCHTQLPAASRPSGFLTKIVDRPHLPEDMFRQAELVFTMWEFDWALKLYEQLIAEFPKNKLKTENLRTAFERELTVFSRIKRDPKRGAEVLRQNLKNKAIPGYLRRNVRQWIKEFEFWSRQPVFNVSTATDAQLDSYVSSHFDLIGKSSHDEATNLVSFLTLSGILDQYLDKHPDTQLKPKIFYWLGLCENKFNPSFFYSLSDLYLKQCIISYPESDTAPRCLDEYKKTVLNHYLVHHQNQVPKETSEEIEHLEALIKEHQRSKE